MKSKRENIEVLFFEEPTKEWHFEEILSKAKITRGKATQWLKQLQKKSIIKRVKIRGRMPHYIALYNSPEYRQRKKSYAQQQLYESGLLTTLSSLKKAQAVILFGSYARSDWTKESDIDIFIYGEPDGLKIVPYERKLGKTIQLFICKEKKELLKFGEGLLTNIIKGIPILGYPDFVKVNINA